MESSSRLESIFFAALEKRDAGERAALLDEACLGDVAMRQRLERMLEGQEGNFLLRSPEAPTGVSESQLSEGPGAVIGDYKLNEQIGEGGMGLVFAAEQWRPVRRRVALKLIKPGMDTRQVIARFEAEKQALALMDHPHIAKVLDAGATDSGRPYFVMELVPGVAITEYCDQCRLTTPERLELFVMVCQAVQHAHQKGVIHRDIKPTNVLVSISDGRPAPKIIDFGVAKAINQRLTEHTLATGFAQMIGTPMYMSPEQAELSPLGVDTRSDIYSLGVLLYELLTGATPYDKDRLQSASYDELRRIIREEEPPRPSTRLSTLANELAATVADRRRTDARRLAQSVRGELDWIVMKCLEKDRNRRYESAGSLARDVGRYLRDEPVQACPPSFSYRAEKFIRRNKIAVAFVLLLVLAVAALSVSNIQTRRSQRQAVTLNAKAQAISALLQDMLRSANPDEVKDADYTVRQLLDDFASSFEAGLPDQKEVESDIRATIGRAYWRLGASDKAEPQLKKALELRQELFGPDAESVAQVLVEMAWCRNDQANFEEAAETARQALRIFRARGTKGAPEFRAMAVLQRVLIALNDLDAAEQVTREALDEARKSRVEYPELAVMLHGQADLLVKRGRYPAAEEAARQAVDMHRRLNGPMHPETAWGLRALADALQHQNKLEEAEDALRKALAIFRQRYRANHFSIANATNGLKSVLAARDDQAGLAALAREEAEQAKRADHAGYHLGLARLLLTSSAHDEATRDVTRQLIGRAIEEYAQVSADSPQDLALRLAAADGYVSVAQLCANKPESRAEVEEAHRRLIAELKDLLASFPGATNCEVDVAHRHRMWAYAVEWNGEFRPQAEQSFREATILFERRSRDNSDRSLYLFFLADTYTDLGDVLSRSGNDEDAQRAFEQAMRIQDEHATEIQEYVAPPHDLEIVEDLNCIAYFLAVTRQEDEAAKYAQRAGAYTERLTNVLDATSALYYLALLRLRLGDEAGYREACASLAESLDSEDLGDTEFRRIWAWCLGREALADTSMALKHVEALVAKHPQNPDYLLSWGALLYRNHQYEQAAQRLQESIARYGHAKDNKSAIVYSKLFLAMTNWQLGHEDESRRILADARPAVDEELRSPASAWNRRATLEILRQEAESLISQRDQEATETKAEPIDEAPNDVSEGNAT